MAYYLVKARYDEERLNELSKKLKAAELKPLQPYGEALTHSLKNARLNPDGRAIWEEEDYCSPPLAEEREAVLDKYFKDIEFEKVDKDEGWDKIFNLPKLFPEF